jgi:hypothetical protein
MSHNTQTQHLKSHDSTHETSNEYHPTVVQCHHGKYHPKLLHSERSCHLWRELHNFANIHKSLRKCFLNLVTVPNCTFSFKSRPTHRLNDINPTSGWRLQLFKFPWHMPDYTIYFWTPFIQISNSQKFNLSVVHIFFSDLILSILLHSLKMFLLVDCHHWHKIFYIVFSFYF